MGACCGRVGETVKASYQIIKKKAKSYGEKVSGFVKRAYRFAKEGLDKFGRVFEANHSSRNQAKNDKQVEEYNQDQDDSIYCPDYFDIKAKPQERVIQRGVMEDKAEIVYEPSLDPEAGGVISKVPEFAYTDQLEDELKLEYMKSDLREYQIITRVSLSLNCSTYFLIFRSRFTTDLRILRG